MAQRMPDEEVAILGPPRGALNGEPKACGRRAAAAAAALSLAGLAAVALLGAWAPPRGPPWARPVVEASAADCAVELFEGAGFVGASALFGPGLHLEGAGLARRKVRSLKVRGGCVAVLSEAAGLASPWRTYDQGLFGSAGDGADGVWVRSLAVLPGVTRRGSPPDPGRPLAGPGCRADLHEYDGNSSWPLRASVGVGLHLAGELLVQGLRGGATAIQVRGECVAVVSKGASLSTPWTYHTEASLDLEPLSAHGGTAESVGSVLLLPHTIGLPRPSAASPRGGGAAQDAIERRAESYRADGIPAVVYVTCWLPTVSGPLLTNWLSNLAYFPEGTVMRYFNDAQMARSAREISDELSRAGVVNGSYEAFKNLRPMAYRADLWRYMVLWQYGGMYFDHKLKVVAPIKDWIDMNGGPTLWVVKDDEPPGIYNAVMAATPRSPVLEQVLRHVVGQISQHAYPHNPLDITGPQALSHALGMFGVQGVSGNWKFRGFSRFGPDVAPRIFARFVKDHGLRLVSMGPEEHVFATEPDSLHNLTGSAYNGFFYSHTVYCDEPGPPCPAA